jgi:hypothetical protein
MHARLTGCGVQSECYRAVQAEISKMTRLNGHVGVSFQATDYVRTGFVSLTRNQGG